MISHFEIQSLPLTINGRGKRYGNRHSKELIGLALECIIGMDMGIVETGRKLNIPTSTIGFWMSNYWFYHKVDEPIILTLSSDV
jgi:hypothetical protein